MNEFVCVISIWFLVMRVFAVVLSTNVVATEPSCIKDSPCEPSVVGLQDLWIELPLQGRIHIVIAVSTHNKARR